MAAISLDELFTEIDKISEIEKCQTCQCFYDTLVEFRELLSKGKNNEEMKQRLSTLIQNAEITHNCLGCEPCLPVPVSNRKLPHYVDSCKVEFSAFCSIYSAGVKPPRES